MRIIQISDTHISRDVPARAADLELCIRHVNELDPQPDVIIHTGDVAHDGCADEYETARRLLDTLSAPYFVIPGNRDSRDALIETFKDDFYIRPGMGFVQYSVERFATRLIFGDTVSGTTNKGRFCEARLGHISEMLAADVTRQAVLFLHHPPFEVSAIPDPFQFEAWSEVDALTTRLAESRQLCGVYCGHVHRSIDSAIGAIPASTISCVAADLRKGKTVASELDRPMFKILDIPLS